MSPELQFWQWFQENEEKLFHFERDQETVFDRLAETLAKVNEDLTFEFGPVSDGIREFVISAAGIRSAFPAVQSLYDVRPELNLFDVIAFRPRRQEIGNIEYANLTIKACDVYYKLCRDNDLQKIGILLFLPGYTEDLHTEFGQIGYLFLDEALGEYDMETRVGFIKMMGHDSEYFDGAYPIQELADHFDEVIKGTP